MRKIFLLLLVCILGVTSCKKNYTTVVKGRIINKYTQKPIEGVSITLKDAIMSDDLISSSTTTDANGYYEVSIKSKSKIAYLGLGHEMYHSAITQNGLVYGATYNTVPYGQVNEFNMTMTGRAYFRGYFLNANALDSDSCFVTFLRYDDINKPMNIETSSDNFWHIGKEIYSKSLLSQVHGDTYLRFKIKYEKNNIWYDMVDSVFLHTKEDTQYFDINF